MNAVLLSRSNFREAVFARDGGKCVFCGKPAVDAHHILERRLFDDGGYYLGNGASVCAEHHLQCEQTLIAVEDVRQACGIAKAVLPEHLYDDAPYDKWGNEILGNGQRLRGELWHDESVQKVLQSAGMLGLFTNRVKYGRTYHLPWSEGMHDDDRMLKSTDAFHGKRVIATVKMDGENSSMYPDYFHARSVDGRHHASRDWVKGLWASVAQDIPQGWRICGENLYAKHSIAYDDLPSYFLGISVWNDRNVCLAWDETTEWFELLGLKPMPVIYDGIWDEKLIRKLYDSKRDWDRCEGYVVRTAEQFAYSQFRKNVAKFVRKNHVATGKHWMFGRQVERNHLAASV